MNLALVLPLALALALALGCAAVDGGGTESDAPPPAGARLYRIILPVDGLDAAARFYAAVLGTPGSRVSAGRHYFDCGGTILACYDPRADGDGHAPAPLPEWIYFAVDDVGAARERCLAAGATPEPGDVDGTPAGEVARRPWGELSVYLRDPSGNGICFVDRTTTFTGPH